MTRERLRWLIRQLWPCTYRSTYWEHGDKHFCVWRMWFGHCFDVDDVILSHLSGGQAPD